MSPDWLGEPFAFKDNKLSMTRKVHKRLLSEAQEAFPYEYSALLTGRDSIITGHIPMPTSTSSMHTFSWDGAAFLGAISAIRKANVQWLGVVHTHPHSPPIPSEHDRTGWHYPSLSYWIVSLCSNEPEWSVYQWVDQTFEPRDYTLTEDT